MPDAADSPPVELTHALPDLAAWTAHFRAAEIPVLAQTADALEALRAERGQRRRQQHGRDDLERPADDAEGARPCRDAPRPRVVTDVETVTSALVMMGISPFFRAFGPQPTVKSRLAGQRRKRCRA